jgi:thymidylate synthase (FAD)
LSHEDVRHRAGTAFSQLSQRYVSGRVLRFVERPEYQDDEFLHSRFMKRIDTLAQEYKDTAEYLYRKQKEGNSQILSAESKTDLRKKVQQAARSVLPNETETIMVMTGNVRAWRHIISMRASEHGEVEIRQAMFNVFQILKQVAPTMFQDFVVVDLSDGTQAVKTPYPKV